MELLASLKPYYYYLIGEGIKTIEIRKILPKAKDWNQQINFYMSKDEKSFADIPQEFREKYRKHFGKVGLTCRFNGSINIKPNVIDEALLSFSCLYDYIISDKNLSNTGLTQSELKDYGNGKVLYGWCLVNTSLIDTPLDIDCFAVKNTSGCYLNNCAKCRYFRYGDCWCDFDIDMFSLVCRPPQSYCFVKRVGDLYYVKQDTRGCESASGRKQELFS